MKKILFNGSGVAIVTPFCDNGSVNYEKLGDLIEFQLMNKTDAIIVCGTTGEASTLTDDEHKSVIEFAVKKVAKRVPVIAGTGSNDTLYSLELSSHAKSVGCDALLQVSPYYNKTTQTGLIKHFNYIADRVDLPMILYNVPSRTGMDIQPETYAQLAKHDNIIATKEANGDMEAIIKTIDLCGDNLNIYSGNDCDYVPVLSVGGLGVISVMANIIPKQTHDIYELFTNGKIKESFALHLKYTKLITALFVETNPIPIKTAMNLMGFDVGELRMPLCEMSDKNLETLRIVLKTL